MTEGTLNKLILAEDEIDIRAIAKIALEKIGKFDVSYCGNGREVLETVESVQPDLILLDVMMPEMDGVMTFKALREKPFSQKIPVIFMTAKIQPHEVDEYLKMGAIGVINKPFDPMTLSQTIRDLWKKSQGT